MCTLQRWSGDPNDPVVVTTQYASAALLIADVRANDNLSEDEFLGFLLTGSYEAANRGITLQQQM